METLPIQAVPNQQFSVVLDDNRWDITIKTTNGTISVSLTLNNEVVIENLRAVAGVRIIPAEYQEAGNFAIITQNLAIPEYTQFGVTQALLYFSAAELAVMREPIVPPITAADFDPIAALPLRFAPQGYELA